MYINSSNTNTIELFISRYRYQIVLFLLGTMLIGFGLYKKNTSDESHIQIIEEGNDVQNLDIIVVEIAGAVTNPGVYEIKSGSRINDLIEMAGGFQNEDSEWIEKFINKASVLKDGQKVIIPKVGDHSMNESDSNFVLGDQESSGQFDTQSKYVNINTASQTELESLWGIGPVYAQKIIEHRPYSSIDELLDKGVIKKNVFERNKNMMSVY